MGAERERESSRLRLASLWVPLQSLQMSCSLSQFSNGGNVINCRGLLGPTATWPQRAITECGLVGGEREGFACGGRQHLNVAPK